MAFVPSGRDISGTWTATDRVPVEMSRWNATPAKESAMRTALRCGTAQRPFGRTADVRLARWVITGPLSLELEERKSIVQAENDPGLVAVGFTPPTRTNKSGCEDDSAMPSRDVVLGNVCSAIGEGTGDEYGDGRVYRVAEGVKKSWVRRRSPLGRTAMFSIHEGCGNCVMRRAGRGRDIGTSAWGWDWAVAMRAVRVKESAIRILDWIRLSKGAD